jgi:hypothetical protein
MGKLAQARGTITGAFVTGRSAARRVSPLPQGRGVARSRKGRRSRSPSLRGSREPRVWLPARRIAVAEVGRRRLASNKLGKRAPKRAAGSSERGPRSARRSAGDTVGRRVERNVRRESDSPPKTVRIGGRPRVTRDRHPAALTSPKAVRGSRDRGCNGHRILRRALTDGRHPGSFMRRLLSRAGVTGGLGVLPHPPTRANPSKRGTHGQFAAPVKAGGARG